MINTTKQEVQNLLTPYIGDIQDCVNAGFNDYQSLDSAFKTSFEIRTRANIIRDRTIEHLKNKFSFSPVIKIIEDSGLFLLNIENKLMIRFHKLNDNLTISSDRTKRTKLFMQQDELFPEYISDVTNLIAGYRVNLFWDKITFHISCPNGRILFWSINFDENIITPISGIVTNNNGLEEINERIRIKTDKIKKATNYGNES